MIDCLLTSMQVYIVITRADLQSQREQSPIRLWTVALHRLPNKNKIAIRFNSMRLITSDLAVYKL